MISGTSMKMNQSRPESWDIVSMLLRGVAPPAPRRSNLEISGDCLLERLTLLRRDCFAALRLAMTSLQGSFCDRHKLISFETCAAHQRTVNVGIGKKFRGVGPSHGTAIQDADGCRGLCSEQFAQGGTNDLLVHKIGVLATGGFSRPNRPDGFVGDDDLSCGRRVNASQASTDLAA